MRDALAQFHFNIQRARDICALALVLESQLTSAIDVSDLLRSALVLAVSAFDHFIHEVTRRGMIEIADGKRKPTEAYLRFSVSLKGLQAAKGSSGWVWLDQEIRERHGWLSFQDPEKMSDALRIVTAKKVWLEIGICLGIPARDAKSRLRLIIDRGNKIAHEADMDPTVPGVRWPITIMIVEDGIAFLCEVAECIVDYL